MSALLVGALTSIVLSAQGKITIPDLLLIGFGVALLSAFAASCLRNPRVFMTALWERVRFAIWVPIALLLILCWLAIRASLIVVKLGLKLVIWLVASIAYLVMPIDLVPDFLIGLGQIDDIVLFVTLAIWAVSAGVTGSLKNSITVIRPQTAFP